MSWEDWTPLNTPSSPGLWYTRWGMIAQSLQAQQRVERAKVLRRGHEVTSVRALGYTIFSPGQMKSIYRTSVHTDHLRQLAIITEL